VSTAGDDATAADREERAEKPQQGRDQEVACLQGVGHLCRILELLLAACRNLQGQKPSVKPVSGGGEARDGDGGEAEASAGLVLATVGEEMTCLGVLVLIDTLLPSLALALPSRTSKAHAEIETATTATAMAARLTGVSEGVAEQEGDQDSADSRPCALSDADKERVCARQHLEQLMKGVELVSCAKRPCGSGFAAHLAVGARVRSHLLLLLRTHLG
jgi:hypothetical protein